MTATATKNMNAALREYFEERQILDMRIDDLAIMAREDLRYGPGAHDRETPYPGFSSAIDELREWANDNISTLYYDDDCECTMLSEPEGEETDTGEVDDDGAPIMEWVEPAPYYTLERRDVLRALFGQELAGYI